MANLFSLAKSMTALHYKGRPQPPRIIFWLVVAILVPLMYRSRWKNQRLERKARRLLRRRTRAASNLVSPHLQRDSDGYPNEPALRAWLASYVGRPVSPRVSHDLLKACWRAPGKDMLCVFDPDDVYLDLTSLNQSRQTPFDVMANGGHIIFLTNRSNNFVSYLLPKFDWKKVQNDPAIPDRGYTNFWVLRHVAGFTSPAQEPRCWPPLPHEADPKASPGDGPWIVLRDPLYDKWREPHSWRTIIGRFSNAEAAYACAKGFCAGYNIDTCVAELVEDSFWH